MVASLVRMQTTARHNPEGDELRAVLEELGRRVDTVAHLHRDPAHVPSEAAIDLGKFLQESAGAVVAAMSAPGCTTLLADCEENCLVAPEIAMPIGLIVVELVTNSVKYAHPTGVDGKIRLGCRRHLDGAITVDISDDGVGLPEGLDPMKAGMLGLRLVRSLAGQIGARIRFSQDPLGLSFVLELPAATPAQLELSELAGAASRSAKMENKSYRCYFTDGDDRIRTFEQIECIDDATAVLKVEHLLESSQYGSAELWQGKRLVGKWTSGPGKTEARQQADLH